jgi:SAM-dependent methyltransferase
VQPQPPLLSGRSSIWVTPERSSSRLLEAAAGLPTRCLVSDDVVTINEWGFAAEIKSWWDAEFVRVPEWKLDRCGVEDEVDTGAGAAKRSDLTVREKSGKVVLAGELRLPDHLQADPWDPENLFGATQKARALGARWAFTSDTNRILLIDTDIKGPIQDTVVAPLTLTAFADRKALDLASARQEARDAWTGALQTLVPLVRGAAVPVPIAPDERFIQSLRGLLRRPILAIADALDRRRLADKAFEADLVRWMVDEQGWAHLAKEWEAEIRRTAALTAYVFTTRLMFYEALRRAEPTLKELDLRDSMPAAAAAGSLEGYFTDARTKSKDYETLFTWDRACVYALIDDDVVPGWARVIERLHNFDLAHIDYDVVGRMFERLIEPHERYRYGQHYTVSEVVDLMLSFGLQLGEGPVADFACGGGTFLVRAYARLKAHHPELTHQELLERLYGCDISAFAASLSTVNLAVRDLVFQANYPRVTTKSFFRIEPGEAYMEVPAPGGGETAIVVPPLRAVTCNPPYVRVQKLSKPQREEAEGILGRKSPAPPVPSKISGLANYHVFFWLQAARFLDPDGRLVFITAGEWMDSDYGVVLQEWLLDHFRIVAFIESMAEPWFSEARVGTVVTIAERCNDAAIRDSNLVRFATLRRTLASLYGPTSDPLEHFGRVDALRDRILALTGDAGESDDFDWKTITQRELRALGMEAAQVLDDEPTGDGDEQAGEGPPQELVL